MVVWENIFDAVKYVISTQECFWAFKNNLESFVGGCLQERAAAVEQFLTGRATYWLKEKSLKEKCKTSWERPESASLCVLRDGQNLFPLSPFPYLYTHEQTDQNEKCFQAYAKTC